jgi:MarR family transcriptional regulator for hemolysin
VQHNVPIGLQLTRVSRTVSRAFDEALAAAGGTLPVWLVLLNLKIRSGASQRELAGAVGVTDATLTHHLDAMERERLLTRRRNPSNRRTHRVELTPAGEEAFLRLRDAAVRFDRRLRAGLDAEQVDRLRALLDRLCENAGEASRSPKRAASRRR